MEDVVRHNRRESLKMFAESFNIEIANRTSKQRCEWPADVDDNASVSGTHITVLRKTAALSLEYFLAWRLRSLRYRVLGSATRKIYFKIKCLQHSVQTHTMRLCIVHRVANLSFAGTAE